MLSTATPPPPSSASLTHHVLQKSGHVQQVPVSHTREKCVTLTAVSAALPSSATSPHAAVQVGWIDFVDYITACEEEQVSHVTFIPCLAQRVTRCAGGCGGGGADQTRGAPGDHLSHAAAAFCHVYSWTSRRACNVSRVTQWQVST